MKRVITIILCLSMLVLSTQIVYSKGEMDIPQNVMDYMIGEMESGASQIDLSDYDLTNQQLAKIMQTIKYENPYLFYVERNYGVARYSEEKIAYIVVYYSLSGDELTNALEYVNTSLNEIVDTIPQGLDDLGKALYLHDYIVMNFEYDTTNPRNYDIYNMLSEKTGVCEAYTSLYIALLDKVGIDANCAFSEEKAHVWCQIKLDGKWYYVDVTWDDPLGATILDVYHKNFILSETGLEAHANEPYSDDHGSDVDYRYPAVDEKYDGYKWHDIETAFVFIDGNIYCLDGDKISTVNLQSDTYEPIYTIEDIWFVGNTHSYWVGTFSTIAHYGNYIFFNESKTVKALDVSSNQVTTICSIDSSDNIYGVRVTDDVIYYYTSDNPAGELTANSIPNLASLFEPQTGCGGNLDWTYDESSHTLTIMGTGEMYDFAGDTPWAEHNSEITNVVIETGCSRIGDGAFSSLSNNGVTISVPFSVTSISTSAFAKGQVIKGKLCSYAKIFANTNKYQFVMEGNYTPGDINGDTAIDLDDLVLLRRYLQTMNQITGEADFEVENGIDVNGDLSIDVYDLIMLRIYFANIDPSTQVSNVVLGPAN